MRVLQRVVRTKDRRGNWRSKRRRSTRLTLILQSHLSNKLQTLNTNLLSKTVIAKDPKSWVDYVHKTSEILLVQNNMNSANSRIPTSQAKIIWTSNTKLDLIDLLLHLRNNNSNISPIVWLKMLNVETRKNKKLKQLGKRKMKKKIRNTSHFNQMRTKTGVRWGQSINSTRSSKTS